MYRFCALTLGLLFTTGAFAEQPLDLTLLQGAVHGQIVLKTGQPATNVKLQLKSLADAKAAHAVSDESGRFKFMGVRPGVHQLTHGRQTKTLRVWPKNAAPPTAGNGLLLTAGSAVRGQGGRQLTGLLITAGSLAPGIVAGIINGTESGSP